MVTLIATGSNDRSARVWDLQASLAAKSPQAEPGTITLRLAVSDGGGRPSEPYVLEFIEQVKTISNGSITIEPIWQAGDDTSVGFESGVIEHVMKGDVNWVLQVRARLIRKVLRVFKPSKRLL
jgi:TRAP-type C4-dicarboxylate transport system substrate-binding protein